MNVAVVDMQPGPITYAPPAEVTPMQMLQIAVAQGADLDRIQKLMDLQDRWQAAQAREAYVTAVAGFKSEPAKILKSKKVNIPGGAQFSHATLADVCDGVVANLSKYGLSHSYVLNQMENGWVEVTCVITHKAGHSERTTLRAPPDESGKKNSIQQIASTVSYLERYTLVAALGLAAKDMDDDGRGGKKQQETLSDEQVANLEALLTEVGTNKINFLGWARVASLNDILACNYTACVKAIEQKRKP